MKAFVAVMARELRDRWTLALAVFCFGWMPLVLALAHGGRAVEIAAIIAVPVAWSVALLMGGSVIVRDLADGRLGFFFARPVPWWAIAGGKLLAALLLTIATAFAGALPAMLAEGNFPAYARALVHAAASGALAFHLVLVVGLIAFAHAAGVVYRSRSTWAALDVALFAASVLLAIYLYRAFARLGAALAMPPEDLWRLTLQLFLLALVPLAAAAAQVAVGRSDFRRGHRALSLTLWSGALVWFAVLGGLLALELAERPADFARRHVGAATSDGRFLAVIADRALEARRLGASFLLDTESGRSLRTPILSPLAFAADGRHAAWAEEAPLWRRHLRDLDLTVAQLSGPVPVVETLELDPPLPAAPVEGLALDAGAGRVAVVQALTLSVHELPSGRSISRTAGADGEWVTAAFLADGRVRALRRVRPVVGGPGRATLPGFLELVELAGGVPSSRVPLDGVGHAVLASGIAGERILLFELGASPVAGAHVPPRSFSLHEAPSGRRLRAFQGEDGWTVTDAALLDGGVAVVERREQANRLRLAVDGEADRFVELPAGFVMLGGQLPGARIAVGVWPSALVPRAGEPHAGEALIVSLAAGEVVRREADLVPTARAGLYGGSRELRGAATLFETNAGELVRLDPATGSRQVVLAAAPR
jgi:hypothetical protein